MQTQSDLELRESHSTQRKSRSLKGSSPSDPCVRESHMDGDIEEKEAPKDVVMIDSTPEEHIPEEKNETVEPEIPVDPHTEVMLPRKYQHGSETLCKKQKSMQLSLALSKRARNHASFLAIWC